MRKIMIFNLKYLILPLSIVGCINTYNINAMEENEFGEYKNDVNEKLKNRVRKALDYIESMDTEILGEDVVNNMMKNFYDFLRGSGTLDEELLQEIEDIIKNYNFNDYNFNDYKVKTEKNENIQLSENIIDQLRSDLFYYYEYDNDPSLLDLKIKMDSGTLNMEEKKFLLDFYNEKNKNKRK